METVIGIKLREKPKVIVTKPENVLGKLGYFFSGGLIGDKIVFEQFNVPETIELISDALIATGITNVIYIAKDYIEVYNENEFDANDLKKIIDEFIEKLKEDQFIFYQNIEIQLLYRKNYFHHYIRVLLHQNHAFSDYPISINISTRKEHEIALYKREAMWELVKNLEKKLTEILDPVIINIQNADYYTWEPVYTELEKKLNPNFDADNKKTLTLQFDPICPISGVMLGVTKNFDLTKNGKHSKIWNQDVYILNSINFISYGYDIRGLIIKRGDIIPLEIEKLGFSWKHSFNSTIKVLQQLGCKIYINKQPSPSENEGKIFDAEIFAVLKTEKMPYNFEIFFKSEQPANSDTPETLYLIKIIAIVESSLNAHTALQPQ